MIGKVLRSYRVLREIGVRDLGKEIGVSAATISRIEQGKPCDGRTFVKIFNWLFKEQQG